MSAYQQEKRGTDAAAWLRGERDETGTRQPGVAGMTVEALREAGLLNEIVPTKEGLMVWSEEWTEMDELAPQEKGERRHNKKKNGRK